MTRVAVLQMCSSPDQAQNLRDARVLLEQARQQGAVMSFLPENFSFMGFKEKDRLQMAESEGSGPVQQWLAEQSRALTMWIVAGTLPLKSDSGLPFASCLVFDDGGRQVARYDKIHLFDVSVTGQDGERLYRESSATRAGQQVVLVNTPAGRLGLSVCYDVRFPELYRALVDRGAELLSVPSAFTVPTGRAHWEVLLRARAIENQAFVLAPAQTGKHEGGRDTWGDSMIVDPWGNVMSRLESGIGVVMVDLDREAQVEMRAKFPSLAHRKFKIGL
jgi:predicted amidohydrolase